MTVHCVVTKRYRRTEAVAVKKLDKQEVFVRAYARVGTIVAAAEITGIDPYLYWNVWAKDPAFVKRVEEQRASFVDVLENFAVERATVGTEEPIYQNGVLVGTVMKKSDALMALLLRGNAHKKYANVVEAVNKNENTNVNVEVPVQLDKLTDEQLRDIARLGASLSGRVAPPESEGGSAPLPA